MEGRTPVLYSGASGVGSEVAVNCVRRSVEAFAADAVHGVRRSLEPRAALGERAMRLILWLVDMLEGFVPLIKLGMEG